MLAIFINQLKRTPKNKNAVITPIVAVGDRKLASNEQRKTGDN